MSKNQSCSWQCDLSFKKKKKERKTTTRTAKKWCFLIRMSKPQYTSSAWREVGLENMFTKWLDLIIKCKLKANFEH